MFVFVFFCSFVRLYIYICIYIYVVQPKIREIGKEENKGSKAERKKARKARYERSRTRAPCTIIIV